MVDVGDVVAGYKLERELGCGGMGRVFAVNNEKYALKLPNEDFQRRFYRHWFENEARITKDLSVFPCFPDYIDSGISKHGIYLVTRMDLGILLSEFYENEHNKPDFIKNGITVLRNAAVALQSMHLDGKLHCDVKPENCFYDEGTYDARLFDFGISCYGIEDEDDILIRPDRITVSPAIISALETLITGEHTVYSYVFSFGILAYEVLANAHPLFGKYSTKIIRGKKGFLESEEMERSSYREFKAMQGFVIKYGLERYGIPKEVASVVQACLAFKEERADSFELVDRLNGLLEVL